MSSCASRKSSRLIRSDRFPHARTLQVNSNAIRQLPARSPFLVRALQWEPPARNNQIPAHKLFIALCMEFLKEAFCFEMNPQILTFDECVYMKHVNSRPMHPIA